MEKPLYETIKKNRGKVELVFCWFFFLCFCCCCCCCVGFCLFVLFPFLWGIYYYSYYYHYYFVQRVRPGLRWWDGSGDTIHAGGNATKTHAAMLSKEVNPGVHRKPQGKHSENSNYKIKIILNEKKLKQNKKQPTNTISRCFLPSPGCWVMLWSLFLGGTEPWWDANPKCWG